MAYIVVVYVHVLGVVFLTGFALFGAILTLTGADGELVERTHRATWPPKGLSSPVQMPVFALGWLALLATAGTGAMLLAEKEAGAGAYAFKLGLVGLVFLAFVALSSRPRGPVLVANLILVLSVVVVATMLAR